MSRASRFVVMTALIRQSQTMSKMIQMSTDTFTMAMNPHARDDYRWVP